jgi:DNA-binding response OmpR family regulator
VPIALICHDEDADVEQEIGHTLLWRSDFERHFATRLEAAQTIVLGRPDIVVIDRDLDWAERLVKGIRGDSSTRALSIAVVARGDLDPAEIELLEAGANAVLRLPAGPDWDKRLARLIHIAARKKARFPVQFQMDASFDSNADTFPAVCINLSETGMLIECDKLEIGSEIYFACMLPGQAILVHGRARVRRLAGAAKYGVEFTEIQGEALEQIREFIEGTQAEGGAE